MSGRRVLLQTWRGDAAGDVRFGTHRVARMDGIADRRSRVLAPVITLADPLEPSGRRPEVVANDYVCTDPQVVRVYLLHHVGIFDVRRGGPSFNMVVCILQNVSPAPLELRPGSTVQKERLSAAKPVNN